MNEVIVSPSILSCDFTKLSQEIEAVKKAGAQWVHIDVMDGHFVPNITIGPPVVKSISKVTDLFLDVHLMIENPENYIVPFAEAGSHMLTFHIEATKDPESLCQKIRDLGVQVGVTLKPATPIEPLLKLIPQVDMVLIMTVNPGFSGQKFMRDQVEKIKIVKEESLKLGKNLKIQVDGGINDETVKICKEAGANVFVAGNFVFKNDYKTSIALLKGDSQ